MHFQDVMNLLNNGNSVIVIGAQTFSGLKLISINVDINNEIYESIDGVLYNKKENKLVKNTNAKNDNDGYYDIPNGKWNNVTDIETGILKCFASRKCVNLLRQYSSISVTVFFFFLT